MWPLLHKTRSALTILAVLLVLVAAVACDGTGDEDGLDGEEDGVRVTGPAATETPSGARATPVPSVAPVVAEAPPTTAPTLTPAATVPTDLQLIVLTDLLETDFRSGTYAFEVDVEGEYGNNPQARLLSATTDRTPLEQLRVNLQWLAGQGFTILEVPTVGGFGELFVDSPVLLSLRHPGFDYNAQYQGGDPVEGELKMDEEKALKRFHSVGDWLRVIVQEAHALDLQVYANIESLAHIINHAQAGGIGGGSGEMSITGNLPAPTVQEVLQFLDDVLAAGPDAVSAEAYTPEYDQAIAEHLRSKGVPYKHTGTDLGDIWAGYYYSFYPEAPAVADVYNYVITGDSLFGATNGGVFAKARSDPSNPRTALVVGAYNPFPCDTSISLADLASPVSNDDPTLPDGAPVENCTTDLWANLLLAGVRRQGIRTIELTADLNPSVAALGKEGFTGRILDRLAAHPPVEQALPIANIVIDIPDLTEEDGFFPEDIFSFIDLSLIGTVDDALQAAGYQTVMTLDVPWTGGQPAVTYIITIGGNEETGDGPNLGPPYWTGAQGLPPELARLLDPAVHPGPVFIHPIFGVPDLANWREVRSQFGLPPRFAYRNPAMSDLQDYHTSLMSSWPVAPDGDTPEGPYVPLTPDTGRVLGKTVHLVPYGDMGGLGQTANLVGADEVAADRLFASGPLLLASAPGRAGPLEQREAPYLITDGQGRFLWLVSQLHHEAFTYIVSQALALATGTPAVLAEPVQAHVWSGRQTFVLAYAPTEAVLGLPFQPGEPVDITVYNVRGQAVRQERGIPYQSPLRVPLDKYSLLVVEPAR